MDRRKIVVAGAAALAVAPLSRALAQAARKVPVVGYVSAASRDDAFARAFRQGLAELGYVEGRTIVIEERYAGGDRGRIPELIEELLSRNVDVFVTGGTVVTLVLSLGLFHRRSLTVIRDGGRAIFRIVRPVGAMLEGGGMRGARGPRSNEPGAGGCSERGIAED